jgi:hypothetical protein
VNSNCGLSAENIVGIEWNLKKKMKFSVAAIFFIANYYIVSSGKVNFQGKVNFHKTSVF